MVLGQMCPSENGDLKRVIRRRLRSPSDLGLTDHGRSPENIGLAPKPFFPNPRLSNFHQEVLMRLLLSAGHEQGKEADIRDWYGR
jgi:hypothetical protein